MPRLTKEKKRRVEICRNAGLISHQVMTDEQKMARNVAGGKAAAANMTPEQRSARARKAALTRFKKTPAK
jgi:hypothetical protein